MTIASAAEPMLDTAAAAIVHRDKSSMSIPSETSTRSANDVRVVRPEDYRQAAACLAEAFAKDHIVRYPIDTPDRAHWTNAQKWDLHVSALEYVTYAHILNGLVTTVGPNYDCVALWMPPGKNIDDFWTILRSGLWRMKYKFSTQGRQRFFSEFLPLLHHTKATILGPRDTEAWYLVYVGTKAGSRGRGYCRKLVEHVTRMADAERRACYLESSNDANLVIYGKMGFHIEQRVHLKEGAGYTMDIMVREPSTMDKAYDGGDGEVSGA